MASKADGLSSPMDLSSALIVASSEKQTDRPSSLSIKEVMQPCHICQSKR